MPPTAATPVAAVRARFLRAVPRAEPLAEPAFDLARAYDEHGRVLFAFAVNALRDRHAAEDCVQEAFLRAWRARDRFDPQRAGERTWLFAILRNVIVDGRRTDARTPDPVDERDDERAAPEVDLLGRLGLLEALARLSPEHREVVVAVHVDGLAYAELSQRTGVPAATLRTRCFAALRALRGHLDESHPQGGGRGDG